MGYDDGTFTFFFYISKLPLLNISYITTTYSTSFELLQTNMNFENENPSFTIKYDKMSQALARQGFFVRLLCVSCINILQQTLKQQDKRIIYSWQIVFLCDC